MLDDLQKKNGRIVFSLDHPEFSTFGRVHRCLPADEIVRYLETKTDVPSEGSVYVPSDPEMEALPSAASFTRGPFGEVALQFGYCNGNNSQLNCFEYHKSSEIDIAATPQVLLLAHVWDILDGHIDSSRSVAFYLPKGSVVELFATTLHFSPCKVCDSGFKTAVILPKGTNLPLCHPPLRISSEDSLLWMTNKWLIACPGTSQAANGAHAGITGENLVIRY